MEWTVQEIEKVCKECGEQLDTYFDCPVEINNRLRTTLGRVCYENNIPVSLQLSGKLLREATDNTIIDTIKHEFAHWYCCDSTGERHGHDNYFRKICDILGCDGNATSKVEYVEPQKPVEYKYTVYCDQCGEIRHYKAKGKVLKNIENYLCPKCKQDSLYYVQNY